MKKLVSAILILSLASGLVFALSSCSVSYSVPDFYLSAVSGSDGAFVTIGHNENLDTYVLVFPDGADRSALTAHCRASVTVNGTALEDDIIPLK